jgi:hypothetical protein
VLPAEPVPDQLQRCRRQDHQINLSRVTPPSNRIFLRFLSRRPASPEISVSGMLEVVFSGWC